MDDELRALERRAATDPAARTALEQEWTRRGLGWQGEHLPAGLTRGEIAPFYLHRGRFRVLWTSGRLAGYVWTLAPPPSADAPGMFIPTRELQELEAQGVHSFVLDIERSVPLFSADLARLLELHDALHARGSRLVVVNLTHSQRLVIELLGLESTLTIADSIAQALM